MRNTILISLAFLLSIISFEALADCPKMDAICTIINKGQCNDQGATRVDSCWSYWTFECEPCAQADAACNAAYPSCQGQCVALSTDQSGVRCHTDATKMITQIGAGASVVKQEELLKLKTPSEKPTEQSAADEVKSNQQADMMRMQNNEKRLLQRQEKERSQKMDDDQRQLLLERQAFERQQLKRVQEQLLEKQRLESERLQAGAVRK